MAPAIAPRHRLDTGITPRAWDFCSLAECVSPDGYLGHCTSQTCPRHASRGYAETQASHVKYDY